MADAGERRSIVLIGTTGVGKSTLGNALLGLDTHATSTRGFVMSPETESCTLDVSAIDGYLLGDRSRPIRVIDAPGHGDGQGQDEVLREKLAKGMRRERIVHAFIWVTNYECPRFDDQDKQFMLIFSQMFGKAFANNLIVVFTRYGHSEEATRKRRRTGASLETQMKGFAKAIGPGFAAPMMAIDACHDADNPAEVRFFSDACNELWRHVQRFSAEPVEHVEAVKDRMTQLSISIAMLTEQLENVQNAHASEREMWQRQLQDAEARFKALEAKINSGPSWLELLHTLFTKIVTTFLPF